MGHLWPVYATPSFKPNLLCRSVAKAPLVPPCQAFLLCLQSSGVAEAASPLQGLPGCVSARGVWAVSGMPLAALLLLPHGWCFLQGQVSGNSGEGCPCCNGCEAALLPCDLWAGWVHIGYVLLHRSTKNTAHGFVLTQGQTSVLKGLNYFLVSLGCCSPSQACFLGW